MRLIQAYDSVWRPLLFKKLEKLGFGGKTLKLIKSMYNNDSLRFVINGKYSREIYLSRGVKQGKFLTASPRVLAGTISITSLSLKVFLYLK